jgi:hypothetical protein
MIQKQIDYFNKLATLKSTLKNKIESDLRNNAFGNHIDKVKAEIEVLELDWDVENIKENLGYLKEQLSIYQKEVKQTPLAKDLLPLVKKAYSEGNSTVKNIASILIKAYNDPKTDKESLVLNMQNFLNTI